MWKWLRKNKKTGKEELCQVQGALRPVQLWEYVFPEESYDEVMTCLNIQKDVALSKTKQAILRKALGASKMKSYDQINTHRFIEHRGVSIHPIGIKKDKRGEMFDPVTKRPTFKNSYKTKHLYIRLTE